MKILIIYAFIGASLAHWVPEMENSDFEGDIELRPDERPSAENAYASIKGGRWPRGVVPYKIHSSVASQGQTNINAAIAEYHIHTCLKFVPWDGRSRGYILFNSAGAKGCSSPVGYRNSMNRISLKNRGCYGKGTIMHEIGHSIGIYHEQSRPDRDKFVTIMWENIPKSNKHNFNKHSTSRIDSLGTTYDFQSIMHYGAKAFGGGKTTIKTKYPSKQNVIGNRHGFSPIDIKQINLMYKCGGTTKPSACRDKSSNCAAWKRKGYCTNSTHRSYMSKNCPRSCGRC